MTAEQVQENIEDGLERLKTSYDACFLEYNRVRLKDLAHILRYWIDMRGQVANYITQNNPLVKFWSYSINNDFTQKVRITEYVITNFWKQVSAVTISTPSINPEILGKPEVILFKAPVPPSTRVTFSIHAEPAIQGPKSNGVLVKHFVIVCGDTTVELDSNGPRMDINKMCFSYKKVGFGAWLDAIAIRVNHKNEAGALVLHDITREKLVKRVANSWGGSHPAGNGAVYDESDDVIRHLMSFELLNRPLPYFILLKMAQDILDAFGKLQS